MDKNKPESETPPNTTAQDVFDLSRLRLSQDFAATIGVKKALLTVPVRKPDRQSFFRVHPDEAYRMPVPIIEVREDRAHYVVDRDLASELPSEVIPKMLFTAINRQDVLFLWPVRLPGIDGRLDDWNRTALEAAELATTKWIRVAANMALGSYDVWTATAELPEPQWPEIPFETLLRIAFKERIISSLDHPVLRRLRGEN